MKYRLIVADRKVTFGWSRICEGVAYLPRVGERIVVNPHPRAVGHLIFTVVGVQHYVDVEKPQSEDQPDVFVKVGALFGPAFNNDALTEVGWVRVTSLDRIKWAYESDSRS